MTDEVVTARICIDCGMSFDLRDSQALWFVSRGLRIPRRCRLCRKSKRERYDAAERALHDDPPARHAMNEKR